MGVGVGDEVAGMRGVGGAGRGREADMKGLLASGPGVAARTASPDDGPRSEAARNDTDSSACDRLASTAGVVARVNMPACRQNRRDSAALPRRVRELMPRRATPPLGAMAHVEHVRQAHVLQEVDAELSMLQSKQLLELLEVAVQDNKVRGAGIPMGRTDATAGHSAFVAPSPPSKSGSAMRKRSLQRAAGRGNQSEWSGPASPSTSRASWPARALTKRRLKVDASGSGIGPDSRACGKCRSSSSPTGSGTSNDAPRHTTGAGRRWAKLVPAG